jgi:carboxypeptidase Taq
VADRTVYNQVIKEALKIRTCETILDVLNWDQETMMPHAACCHRADQKELLAGIIHQMKSAPQYFENLERLLPSSDNDSDESVIIKKLHRDITKARKLPTTFVQTLSRATSEAFDAWQRARSQNLWSLFEPHMKNLVVLMRQKAEYLGYSQHPLDALLDEHEPEATTQEIYTLFSSLKTKLRLLLSDVQRSPLYERQRVIFPSTHEEQMKISRQAVSFIGFDWNRGRLDTSEHPFSTAFHPTDSRITIRNNSNDLLDQVMSALHEAGHGLYEMGLEQQYFGTPLAEPASLSIHESQSRLWETVIGQSKAFSGPLYDILSEFYKQKIPFASEGDLYNDLNRVQCSLIRTQADEVTYPFHVILRFEIEKELLEGTLEVCDIPQRWAIAMKEALDIVPTNDKEGCLQDVHWSLGSFGYFPTYTLGSLYSVCFFQAMKQSLPNVDELIAKGFFAPIHAWLSEHVWRYGRRYSSRELVTKALGRVPTEDDYIEYLRSKYVG